MATEIDFAEDRFVIDFQFRLYNLMARKEITRRILAKKLNITQYQVDQFFSDKSNLTLKEVARIFFILGEEPQITSPILNEIFPK